MVVVEEEVEVEVEEVGGGGGGEPEWPSPRSSRGEPLASQQRLPRQPPRRRPRGAAPQLLDDLPPRRHVLQHDEVLGLVS